MAAVTGMSVSCRPVAAPTQARHVQRCSSSAIAGSGNAFRTGGPVHRMQTHLPRQQQPLRQVTRMGLFGLGVPELALVAGAAALLFGPAKIPQLGQALGKTAKSVKAAADEFQKELQSTDEDLDAAAGNATQKLKEHPQAGEGEGVRDLE